MALSSIQVTHRVQFSETDMAGLVHFSQFFRYMEKAEAAFFEKLGHSMVGMEGDLFRGWPRVRTSASFKAPLYFEDDLEIQLYVKEIKIRAIQYFFRFRRLRSPFSEREKRPWPADVAKGEMTTMLVEKKGLAGEMRGLGLPEDLLAGIAEAPPAAYARPQ